MKFTAACVLAGQAAANHFWKEIVHGFLDGFEGCVVPEN